MQAAEYFSTTTACDHDDIRVVKAAFRGTPLVEGRAHGWMLNCVRGWADRRQVGDFGHLDSREGSFFAHGGAFRDTSPCHTARPQAGHGPVGWV
jgi:hypothetical protein